MFNDDDLYQYPPFNQHRPDPIWNRDSEYIIPVVSSVGNGPRGEVDFSELTPEQIEYIRENIANFRSELLTGSFVTSSSTTTTIQIPIDNFNEDDILFVNIEGLTLMPTVDYTVSGNSITLVTPITHTGTTVNFNVIRYTIVDD